ncbi:hypothetical protein, partial [Cryobacterium sp. MDB2-A-2]|uniref:hypothetical protein n=1 Tax=Cryobacterium sp. MDB2-A-2 TaxID=1259182 RepID=UPI001A7EBE2A
IANAVREARMTVSRTRIVEANAQARVDAAVIKLRALGCTWTMVASALDSTPEGARKRHEAALKRNTTAVAAKGQ